MLCHTDALLIHGGCLFDVRARDLVYADVRVADATITEIGPNLARRDESVLDAAGMTLVPGLVNMHEHLTMRRTWGPPWRQVELEDAYLALRGARGAIAALRQGITTVRELGAKNHVNIGLKRAIARDAIPGPRVLAAGAPISITGGHAWRFATEADGAEGMRVAIRQTLKRGADWIKLISTNDPVQEEFEGEHTQPELGPDEFEAAVATTHLARKRITAHAMGKGPIGWAIAAGVDSVEHGVYLDEELAQRMAKQHVPLIPTLSGYYETTLERWGRGQEWIDKHRHLVEPHAESTKIAIDEGVQIGVGTDTVGDIVEEMRMLMDCGMTAGDVIAAATLGNAEILGWADRIGAIEPGKLADIVLVRGSPVDDIGAMRSVVAVVQAGCARTPAEIGLRSDDEDADWTTLRLLEA